MAPDVSAALENRPLNEKRRRRIQASPEKEDLWINAAKRENVVGVGAWLQREHEKWSCGFDNGVFPIRGSRSIDGEITAFNSISAT